MTLPVRRHRDVEQDILDIAAWMAERNREVAWRFFDAVEDTITLHAGKGQPEAFPR